MEESDRITRMPERSVTEAERDAFVEKHLPGIERAFTEQLNRQTGTTLPATVDTEDSARTHLRGVNGLTEEEWRQLDAERSGRAPEGTDPYAAWDPSTSSPGTPPFSDADPHGATFAGQAEAAVPGGEEEDEVSPPPSVH